MSESLFSELVRYARFDDANRASLRAFHSVAVPRFSDIIDTFYERLGEHPGAAAVLASPGQVERLRVSLRAWLDRLLAGPWDEDYYQLRARIGRVHVKVKLPQRYMFAAISVIRGQLLAVARETCGDDDAGFFATAQALSKILDIELAIMLETYSEDYVAAVQRIDRVERDVLRRRLEITEARYEAIVENAEALIVAVDVAGNIVLFNRKAEHLSGYVRAEVFNTSCVDRLAAPDSRELVGARLAAARRGEAGTSFEAPMITRSGDERWIRWHLTHLAATGATMVCAIGVDVTDERSLEYRTRRVERLAALGTLAAGLAHEIRNPLNAAHLQLMLVDRRIKKHLDATPELARALDASHIVQSELERLAGLVHDFLAFARPSELRPIETDLGLTIETIMSLLEPAADQAGVTLSAQVEPMSIGRFDEERIKQVLLNVLHNAIDAAGDGGQVSLIVTRPPGMLRIEISDTGAGIPAGTDIFEPFVTTKQAGTGLGLPIAHRIVSAHGGDLSVTRRDATTVFTIDLPVDGPPESAK